MKPIHGRLDLFEFLEEIWDLDKLPSSDYRYSSARGDIAQHYVADLTGANGNVLYELGLAPMIGHRAILLTQDMADVPFDLRQQRHIVYQHTVAGVSVLRDALRKAILTMLGES